MAQEACSTGTPWPDARGPCWLPPGVIRPVWRRLSCVLVEAVRARTARGLRQKPPSSARFAPCPSPPHDPVLPRVSICRPRSGLQRRPTRARAPKRCTLIVWYSTKTTLKRPFFDPCTRPTRDPVLRRVSICGPRSSLQRRSTRARSPKRCVLAEAMRARTARSIRQKLF